MEDIEVIVLNDNKYYVMDRIINDSNTYVVLLNINDENDLCVRKEVTIEDKKHLAMLDNEEELKNILNIFANK